MRYVTDSGEAVEGGEENKALRHKEQHKDIDTHKDFKLKMTDKSAANDVVNDASNVNVANNVANNAANNKRIAKNTLLLYVRMLFTMGVSLYTSRVVLQTLGVSDFGLYNVVGGIVTMLAFLNNTLASGTQRFLSFELGNGTKESLNRVFSTAVTLHLLMALIVLLLAETAGLWFLYNKMNIDPLRMEAAFWVYQFSVLTTVVSIMQVPYMSTIIAHEKMGVYAYMSIYEVTMKLLVVFLIQVLLYDKLILYAFLLMLVMTSSALLYNIYCRKSFSSTQYNPQLDKKLLKEMAAFSGWNTFGCLAVAAQGQGLNILLNIFFGTTINAARGIAFQVNSVVSQFVNNFQTAVNPQIVKLYAADEKEKMFSLVRNNSKLAAFLLLFIAIPLFIELEFVLGLWLGEYPEYTPIFVRIIIVQSLLQTLHRPIVTTIHAIGKMKWVNLTTGTVLLLVLPMSYLFLKMGYSVTFIFLLNLIPWLIEGLFDACWAQHYSGFPTLKYYKEVYVRVILVIIPMFTIPYLVSNTFETSIYRFLLVGLTSVATSTLCIYYLGLDKTMRLFVQKQIKNKFIRK